MTPSARARAPTGRSPRSRWRHGTGRSLRCEADHIYGRRMMATTEWQAVDEGKLEQVLGQLVTDMGAAMSGVLVLMGVELGLWRALDNAGPLPADALAERAGMRERYVREGLAGPAASRA